MRSIRESLAVHKIGNVLNSMRAEENSRKLASFAPIPELNGDLQHSYKDQECAVRCREWG